jgi:adenylate kinase
MLAKPRRAEIHPTGSCIALRRSGLTSYHHDVPQDPTVYLTGAPATGKTSVATYLHDTYGARVFSYGQALREHAALRGISHEELRQKSSSVVRKELIGELDASLPGLLAEWRNTGPVIIDSHAVTSEPWGLRAIPYSRNALLRLGLTRIVCLMADGQTLFDRIDRDPAGRRSEDRWKLGQLNNAQVALAASYAHTTGLPVCAIDARRPLDEVCAAVAAQSGFVSK